MSTPSNPAILDDDQETLAWLEEIAEGVDQGDVENDSGLDWLNGDDTDEPED